MEEEDKDEERIDDIIIYNQYKLEKYGLMNDCLALYKDDENQKLICKTFLKKDFESQKKIEELETTILIHKQINHNNIFKLYDERVGENHINVFYEYIKGKTLEKLLNSKNNNYNFEENEIFNIIDQILDILLLLYNEYIILKDLTLNNIYIENKKKIGEKAHILLCNLENENLLSETKKKSRLERYYKKIVFKLGLIICKLLDKNFYIFLKEKKINEEDNDNIKIIINYIEENIFKIMNLSNTTREFIIQTVLSGKESNTDINELKKTIWLEQYVKEIKNKKKKNNNNDKSNTSTTGSIINDSFTSHSSTLKNKNNKKRNVIEEIINTDEGYLELYNKEKEVLLGIIDDFDREEIIKNINDSNKYLKYYKNYCNNHESGGEVTQRYKDENKEEISKSVNPQKGKKKNGHKDFSFFKCYSDK